MAPQDNVVPNSKARVHILLHGNKGHILEGLEEFSHVWLIFLFNCNKQKNVNYKIRPPRLKETLGVFSTRSPHRPNPLGLSLAKLDKLDHNNGTLHLSRIDLVHGTPILDIKPYIEDFDRAEGSLVPQWLTSSLQQSKFQVLISEKARRQVQYKIKARQLDFYKSEEEVLLVITQILENDPRSRYRRKQHENQKNLDYQFPLDNCVVCCKYDPYDAKVHVYAVENWFPGWNHTLTKFENESFE
ncbi:tRNA (adenine(37)-N6)-methyltransferase isoform X2 [Zophobas morio]|uniref:tRNA (adenine(37)-N6)-methyltransferase isoform X2 n=1 Tax=Zophobas morio TaxID=2755281 RepID=UPI00308304B6